MSDADWLRQECLLAYYKNMLSQPHSTKKCNGLKDRLVEFSYYRQNIRSKNGDTLAMPPLKNSFIADIDLLETCEPDNQQKTT